MTKTNQRNILFVITECSFYPGLTVIFISQDDKWVHGFIVFSPMSPFVFVPKKQSYLGQLIAGDNDLVSHIALHIVKSFKLCV
jgi:hypothetical protein